jgi:hypothetical protein
MRLHEIIVEGDWDDVADLSRSNVSQGADTVNKILSPSRWFEKGKTDKSDTNKTAAPQQAAAPAHLNREALASAAAGKELLPQDTAKIKALASQVSTGKLKPHNIDHMQLFMALKMAYQGKPLSDDQKQMVTAFSKQI